jgi:hypothetical protein
MFLTFPTPNPTAATRFSVLVEVLSQRIAAEAGVGRISQPMFALLRILIRHLIMRFQRAAYRVRDGLYVPGHRASPSKSATPRRPRQPSALPTAAGWLARMLPDGVEFRAYLHHLVRDPEMIALLEAGSPTMVRSVRSLCRMLLVIPPPNLPKGYPPRRKPAAPPVAAAVQAAAAPSPPATEPASPPGAEKAPIDWAKPRGSLSNRLYRKRKAPRPRGSQNSA